VRDLCYDGVPSACQRDIAPHLVPSHRCKPPCMCAPQTDTGMQDYTPSSMGGTHSACKTSHGRTSLQQGCSQNHKPQMKNAAAHASAHCIKYPGSPPELPLCLRTEAQHCYLSCMVAADCRSRPSVACMPYISRGCQSRSAAWRHHASTCLYHSHDRKGAWGGSGLPAA